MIIIVIYKITCKVNNKVYIGQTSETIEKRFKRHMGYQNREHDTKFYRAIRKYKPENFYIEQIDTATCQEELDDKEIYWINYYDSVNNGYNTKSSKGKCGGDTLSNHPNREAICEKIRQSKLGDKNPMRIYGGLTGERNGMYGKCGGENPGARKCVAKNYYTGEVLYFDSIQDAKTRLNISSAGMITMRCQGKTKSEYNGYCFKYYEDYMESQSTSKSYIRRFGVENKVSDKDTRSE